MKSKNTNVFRQKWRNAKESKPIEEPVLAAIWSKEYQNMYYEILLYDYEINFADGYWVERRFVEKAVNYEKSFDVEVMFWCYIDGPE